MAILSTLRPWDVPDLRILPAVINWRGGYRVTLEFKTDIITMGDGRTQRRATRANPRKTVEFSCDYAGEAKRMIDMHFATAQTVPCLVPDWAKSVTLLSPIDPPDEPTPGYVQTLRFPATGKAPAWMTPGATVILVNGWHMETREIASAANGSADVREFSASIFPAGTKVYPALRGYPQLEVSGRRLTNTVASMNFTFKVEPGSEQYPDTPAPVRVGLLEYWGKRPNWANPVEVIFNTAREEIDYGVGVVGSFVPYDFPSRLTRLSYVGRNADEIQAVTDFFVRMKGQQGEFITITWEDDVPFNAIAGGGNAILMQGTAFGHAYKGNPVHRRITIRKADGTYLHRLVDHIEALPDTDSSVVWLKEPLPFEAFTPQTVNGISWAITSRLASDVLTIDYVTDSVAQFTLTYQSLEDFEL